MIFMVGTLRRGASGASLCPGRSRSASATAPKGFSDLVMSSSPKMKPVKATRRCRRTGLEPSCICDSLRSEEVANDFVHRLWIAGTVVVLLIGEQNELGVGNAFREDVRRHSMAHHHFWI